MLEKSRSYVSTKDVNIATLAKFEKIWSSNLARNINHFIGAPGINQYFNKFKNLPALVVAAGPSLNKSIEFIRKNQDRALIIAVDTSYGMLKKNGIEPHFCISVDPQVINARYFEGDVSGRTILVADPTVHPSVFRMFKGRVISSGVAFDSMKWVEKLTGERGRLANGGSVSTNAYDFAKQLGADPIIMVGQDLAFTWGLAHARGSYLDEQIHLRTNRVSNVQMFNRYQLTSLPKIFRKGIKTERVHTNQKMIIFLSWFEKQNDEKLINATYDGAFINGVGHVDMDEVDKSNFKSDVTPLVDKMFDESVLLQKNSDDCSKRLKERIKKMIKDIDSLIPILERALGFSENLQSQVKLERDKRDSGKMSYILGKLSETDKILQSKENIKDIISLTIQRVIHTITEGYDIDGNDEALNDDEPYGKTVSIPVQGPSGRDTIQ